MQKYKKSLYIIRLSKRNEQELMWTIWKRDKPRLWVAVKRLDKQIIIIILIKTVKIIVWFLNWSNVTFIYS